MNVRRGFEICEQVDIWMLGCILYTLAFYRHPFQDNATVMAIMNAKYFIPKEHPVGKSGKLVGLVHWLLAVQPRDRPSAAKLCQIISTIAKRPYTELFAELPQSVREKMQREKDLFSARKDVDLVEGEFMPTKMRAPPSMP